MNGQVAAVVVTYNRKALLERCLDALRSQTRPLDRIFVMDNASTDGTAEMFTAGCDQRESVIKYFRLSENVGGAGGFATGMSYALEAGSDWIWLMDDDAVPNANALEKLLRNEGAADILVSTQIDSTGVRYGASVEGRGAIVPLRCNAGFQRRETAGFAFVGPLINRRCILACGFPRGDLFIAGDDTEYALRLRRAGFSAVLIEDSVIFHEYGGGHVTRRFLWRRSLRFPQPDWKAYYEARNGLVIRSLYARRKSIAIPVFLLYLMRLTAGEVLYEPRRVFARFCLRGMGVIDGLRGKLGKTVSP